MSGFLSRWAKRKLETAKLQTANPDPGESGAGEPGSPVRVGRGEPSSDVIPEPLPLPSLDDVVPGADLSLFMQPHVPETLRNAALAKMWRSDPSIRDFIEMADYQWDWNTPGGMPGYAESVSGLDLEQMARRIVHGSPKTLIEGQAMEISETSPTSALDFSQDSEDSVHAATREQSGAIAPGDAESLTAPGNQVDEDHAATQHDASFAEPGVPSRRRHGSAVPD